MTDKKCLGIDCAWCASTECPNEKKEGNMTDKFTTEMCPYCDREVQIPAFLGIYKCPSCGEFIIACSMCEDMQCEDCSYSKFCEYGREGV